VNPQRSSLPELLAPAGDWDCARAAVENGADAIYFGLDRFNARMRAENFTEGDLPRLLEYLHRRGVRGYLSFNTLVFTGELAEAERYLRGCIAAGVDAAIVQDVGICRLIRRLSPDFPIHASTQMTLTSPAGVAFARDLGCQRVILARECSLREIERIQQTLGPDGLDLEVFVHGALCVAYSGQCLTSEALGGRSANRGECAQACRLPYDLVANGRKVPLGDRRYLLSPRDLAGLELLPELVRLGVASLKIEGRLKSPEYVANVTRHYRRALDLLAARTTPTAPPETPHSPSTPTPQNPKTVRYELEMAFSRGLHTGWFEGVNHQALVHGRFGTKRGVPLGEVLRVGRDRVVINLRGPLKPGDGIVFDAGTPDLLEEGGRVYTVQTRQHGTELTFGRGDLNFTRIHVGDRVWKTSDPELDRRLRQTFAGDTPRHTRPVCGEVHGRAGTPLRWILRDDRGNQAEVASPSPLRAATNQPLTADRLRAHLGRLGGTPFHLDSLDNHLDGALHLPLSELNRLRRESVAQLEARRASPPRWTLTPPAAPHAPPTSNPASASAAAPATQPVEARLTVLIRSLPQLEAALNGNVRTVYCEFEDLRQYREALALTRHRTSQPRVDLFVAPPRITKPGEEALLRQIRSVGADGFLVRNPDHLAWGREVRCVGDYSLNVANPLAAAYFIQRFGLERLTIAYDLNNTQLEALLEASPPEGFEITLHQHMPMFHMDHCVFCAFLSTGTNHTDCGRPCDHYSVRLRDRVGSEHPVKADAGCRNTVYNARAQTGAEYADRFLRLGARDFRIEFLDESPEEVALTLECYRRLLRGEITGGQLWRQLRLQHQLGVTRGSLDSARRPITVLADPPP